DDSGVLGVLVRSVPVHVLWALLGAGLGALIRNQVATLAVVFLFALAIEPTLTSLGNENLALNGFLRYLPGAASMSLAWPPEGSDTRGDGAVAALGWESGGLVLAAYAVVLVVLGYLLTFRDRDLADG